jgi:hypothetical protein
MNFCPVCGYTLPYPPADFHICPSCGTEFGYDDAATTYEELRKRWIRTGPSWWSPVDPRPVDWNPDQQMINGLMSNAAGFAGSQGFSIQVVRFLGGAPAVYAGNRHLKRKRPTSQGRTTAVGLNYLGAIASGG